MNPEAKTLGMQEVTYSNFQLRIFTSYPSHSFGPNTLIPFVHKQAH